MMEESYEEEFVPLLKPKTYIKVDPSGVNRIKVTRLVTVEPLVVFYLMATVSAVPLLQQYIYGRLSEEYGYVDPNSRHKRKTNSTAISCGNEYANNITDTTYQRVQAESSLWVIILIGTLLVPTVVVTMFIGPYSDKAGRKRAIIPPLMGGTLRTSVNLIGIALDLPLWTFILPCIIDGCTGSLGSLLTGCFSYAVDISDSKDRLMRMFITETAMGLGMTGANVAVGFMIKSLGYVYPVAINLAIYAALFVYAVYLPETVIKEPNVKFLDCEHLSKTTKLYTVDSENNRRWKLLIVLIIFAMTTMLGAGISEVMTFYFLNPPLCFDSAMIGIYTGYDFVVKGICSVIFMRLTQNFLPGYLVAIIGLISCAAADFILAYAMDTTTVFMAPLAGALMMTTIPIMRTTSSQLVKSDEHGSLFSSMAWVQLSSAAVGSVIFQMMYTYTITINHGYVFILAIFITIIPIVLIVILWIGTATCKSKRSEKTDNSKDSGIYVDIENSQTTKV